MPDVTGPRADPAVVAFELLGRPWATPVLEALLGLDDDEEIRFNALKAQLTGITSRALTERLRDLEAAALAERRVGAGTPSAVHYRLNQRGRALAPVVEAVRAWTEPAGLGRP